MGIALVLDLNLKPMDPKEPMGNDFKVILVDVACHTSGHKILKDYADGESWTPDTELRHD